MRTEDWSIRRHTPRSPGSLIAAGAAGAAAVLLLGAVAVGTHVFGLQITAINRAPDALWQQPQVVSPSTTTGPSQALNTSDLSGPPTELRIPKISVDTTIVPLGLDQQGALLAPDTVTVAGWYAGGTAPGDIGPAIIDGHVDSKVKAGVFKQLKTLNIGDAILVKRGGHWVTFTVVARGQYSKQDFPTDTVYGPTPDAELRLITCGGTFDAGVGSYEDNIVVYAVVAGS